MPLMTVSRKDRLLLTPPPPFSHNILDRERTVAGDSPKPQLTYRGKTIQSPTSSSPLTEGREEQERRIDAYTVMNQTGMMNVGTVQARSYSSRERMTLLPEDFQPSDDDVICGRGKKCYAHVGNGRFRTRVIGMLGQYRKARSKLDKSKVLSDVVEQVRLNSPRGGFVKQDSNGRWFEVGDFLAREKTSQAFRDVLHENYKSSNVAKKKRRNMDYSRPDKMSKPSNDSDIASRMEKLSFDLKNSRSNTPVHSPFSPSSSRMFPKHDRMSGELRRDCMRSDSGESAHRLSTVNTAADMGFGEMHEVGNGYIPFAFREYAEHGMDTRSEVMSRTRRSTLQLSGHRQSCSLPSSPQTVPTVYEDAVMDDDLHHSVPNIHFSLGGRHAPPISEMEAMHHSLPNMYFEPEEEDMEPIPFDLALPNLADKPEHVPSSIVKEERMATEHEPVTISSDLIQSLENLTESAGVDENPFEPIPLSPFAKKRPSLALSKNDFPDIVGPALSDTFEEEI